MRNVFLACSRFKRTCRTQIFCKYEIGIRSSIYYSSTSIEKKCEYKLATRETFREAVLRRIISVEENILAKMIFFFFVGKSVMLAGWRDDTTIRENALKNTGLNQPDVYPPRNISMKRSFIRISGWLPGLLRI